MKDVIKHIILLLSLSQNLSHVSEAQAYSQLNPDEKVSFYTDRSLYISGENIYFSATIISDNSSQDEVLSKVLYVEIINQNNDQIIGQKSLISNSLSTGLINIPRDLTTGIYYLRSYTKYMCNYGPESFCYNQITVLNPHEESILIKNPEVINQPTNKLTIIDDNEYDIFDIETDKYVYRQSDSILIRIIPKIHSDSVRSACISVVPSHSIQSETLVINRKDKLNSVFNYIPENRGITLTGLLLDNNSSQPLPSWNVDLTILGNSSDFISIYTNSAGRFFFPLPELTGQKTVFIGTDRTDSIVPSIMVDNDFFPLSIDLPYKRFMLSENERVTALNLARNFQISEGFSPDTITSVNETGNRDYNPFYGIPTETLNIDDYIQLSTLEDYFNELPYLVKVRKLQRKKYIKIMGTSPGIQIYEPLVLMDMVAVYDINAILSISSKHISHIDIINEPYVKGNITYGGIVSIFSKNNDFAGIDLPPSGVFIMYEFLSDSKPFKSGQEDGKNTPDARNTLFWNGNLQITSNNLYEISFLTGNSQGQYDIVLQGVLKNGNTFFQTVSIRVD